MVDRLHFTDSDAANELVAHDPLALLIGFALDQQVTVQKAFEGPLVLRERVGTLDARELAEMDLEPAFRQRPAIHRFPGSMARRVRELAVHVADAYEGDAARIWIEATGLTETPALIVRFCMEVGREIDPKFYLTTRNNVVLGTIECSRGSTLVTYFSMTRRSRSL